jgi:hypothetical protein
VAREREILITACLHSLAIGSLRLALPFCKWRQFFVLQGLQMSTRPHDKSRVMSS